MKTKTHFTDIPLHGIISYTGDTWSVAFKPVKNETGSTTTGALSGYGKFPFADYPGLPVVNFTKNENVFKMIKEPTEKMPQFGGNLNDYLNTAKNYGIEVINF